jgi:hypothetical protein
MADEKGLELRAISERFAQSNAALDELVDRLKSLKATSDVIDMTNQSTQAATQSIRQVVDELTTLTSLLRSGTKALESATISAASFMSQTDLSGINLRLHEIRDLLNNQTAAAEAGRESAEKSLIGVKAELEASRRETQALKAQLARIPEKYLKKFGA